MQDLAERVALVTGAARGIGQAIACKLAGAGAAVGVVGRPEGTPLEETLEMLRQAGARCLGVVADISDAAAAQDAIAQVRAEFGRVDILVNNAGVSADALLLDLTPQQWQRIFAINVQGTFVCTQAVALVMIEQRAGTIVNLSSITADRAHPGVSGYAATKGAINSFTRAAAVELGRFGIRVNAVAAGVVETELMRRVLGKRRDYLLSHIPLRRFADPQEVAEAVLFLASDRSSYISGEILHVAGGLQAGS